MINIRKSIFETNSSSTHSISLTFNDGELMDTLPPDKNGELLIVGEDFTGIEFEIAGAQSKAALVATYAQVHGDEKLRERFEEVLKKHTGAQTISYDIRFYKQLDGKPANTFYCPDIEDTYYYDADDNEFCFADILKSKKRIAKFIFGKGNMIEAGETWS